jgi:hypothetical protein
MGEDVDVFEASDGQVARVLPISKQSKNNTTVIPRD